MMNPAEQQQTEIYPPPPPWFKLYRPDADGTAERPLPPLPPEPSSEDFTSFGRIESVETGTAPLAVKQLFHVRPDNTVDYKGELQALNKELVIQYLHFVETLVDRPSSYGRDVEAIGTILRNMHFLLNSLRSKQARASLEFILKNEVKDRQDAIADLREKQERAVAVLRECEQLGKTS